MAKCLPDDPEGRINCPGPLTGGGASSAVQLIKSRDS